MNEKHLSFKLTDTLDFLRVGRFLMGCLWVHGKAYHAITKLAHSFLLFYVNKLSQVKKLTFPIPAFPLLPLCMKAISYFVTKQPS